MFIQQNQGSVGNLDGIITNDFLSLRNGKVFAMEDLNDDAQLHHIDMGKGIKFCLNCDDMEDLALDSENGNREIVQRRFQNCQKTGRFNGDMCSRMFVVSDEAFQEEQLTNSDDELPIE